MKELKKYKCPECRIKRINPFPISDESGDTYCPDCNATLNQTKQ